MTHSLLNFVEEATILETPRLYLRLMSPLVFKKLMTQFPDEIIMAILGKANEEELAAEKEKFKKGLSTFNRSFHYFQLIDKVSLHVIGWCGYHTWYFPHFRAELGYELFKEEWRNKGLMKEALTPIIRFGFETMELNRIEAFVSPNNVPSQKLIRHFGFQEEGLMRQHYNFEDSQIFSLLKADYNG